MRIEVLKGFRWFDGRLLAAALACLMLAIALLQSHPALADETAPAAASPAAAAAPEPAPAAAAPAPAAAPTAPFLTTFDKISSGDTAWMLTSTAFVLLMTIPGLALFY